MTVQQQNQGWTKNDQPQEPEPSRDAPSWLSRLPALKGGTTWAAVVLPARDANGVFDALHAVHPALPGLAIRETRFDVPSVFTVLAVVHARSGHSVLSFYDWDLQCNAADLQSALNILRRVGGWTMSAEQIGRDAQAMRRMVQATDRARKRVGDDTKTRRPYSVMESATDAVAASLVLAVDRSWSTPKTSAVESHAVAPSTGDPR